MKRRGLVSDRDPLKLRVMSKSQVGLGNIFAVKRKKTIGLLMYLMLLVMFGNNPLKNTIITPMLKLVRVLFCYKSRYIRQYWFSIIIILN